MKTDSRPTSSGYGRASSSGHQGESVVAPTSRQQRVPSASNRVGSTTYFDIANTILGTAGDFDDLLLGAARDGDYSKIEQLLVQRSDIIVDIDCKDKRTGNTALIWAAKKGHNRIIQLLLRHGADPTLRNYEAQTALEVATGATKTMLLDSVDSGNRANESSHRLLLQAAWQGNLEVIKRLMSSGKVLDINCQNAEGLTPLMLVARDVQLFERLAVQLNRHYNPVEVAKELMKARADVHTCDNDGRSCLHFAAQTRATVAEQLVQTLLGGGSEPAQMDRRQYAAIHWASQMGNTNVVQALLDGGSEVNSRGFAGLTPLHISAHNDHHRTAVTLLQNGANVTLTDDRGLTPVDLAKTRKMKMTLKEAWTEATQNNNMPELAPVRAILSRESGSRISIRDESPGKKRGEVIFDGMNANTQRGNQASRSSTRAISSAEKARRAERQMLQEIESGRYTPSLLHSRENTRLLGTVRNKPGPPVLPNIPPSQAAQGHQSPESVTPRRSSSQDDELRRSLEDGRNMLTQRSNAKRAPLPMRGRLSKTTPISSSEGTQQNDDGRRTHRRTGSDPFSTNFDAFASTLENIIKSRGRSVSVTAEMSSMAQHMSPLRTPLERDTTMCLSIPRTIPESASPGSSFDTSITTAAGNSAVPTHMMALPPTSSRILPPTPTFLTQSSYTNLDQVLSKVPRDDGSSSSKEPSPRSDDEIPDNTFRVGVNNPMELLRSRSLLKEEFILADSRPRDPFMVSSGSDQTSSSSSLSTASSNSPREAGTGFGRAGFRRSDPSLLTVTLRDKALKGAGFRKNDPSSVRKLEMSSSSACGGGGGDSGVSVGCSPSLSEVGVSKDASSAANGSGTGAPKAGEDVIVGKMGRSQSLRMTQRQQQSKQSPSNTTSSSTGNMKRSQSIGSVPSAASTEQQKKPVAGGSLSSTADTQQKQGGSQQDLSKGAPFSGKARMVIVQDSFEFDNVLTAGSTNPKKTPSPPSSSGPPQTSAKKSASHDKPELAYIKESTTLCERSCRNSSEQSVDKSSHQSEASRMSVSDVAISGVLQVDNSAMPDDAFTDDVSQQVQSSGVPGSKCSVPTSQPSNNSGKAGKGQTSVPSKPSPSQAKSRKNPVTSSASSKALAASVDSRVAKIQQAIQNKSAADSTNMNVAKKEGVAPSPSTARTAPSPATTTGNAPISKPAVVNMPSTQPSVSKVSSSVNSSTNTTSKAIPKPVVSNTNPPVSSAASVSAQKSSSEQSLPIRKSASTESMSTQKQSGVSAQGKQTSGEGGKKQNAALSSSVQKGLSASAKDITNRLSGNGPPVSRSNSNSSFTASRSTENSATARSPAGSAAKSSASTRVITSSKQSILATKPSQTTTTTTTSVSKPTTTTPVNIAKVMQSLTKTTNSPRPSISSTSKGPQETVSTNVSAAKPPINSASARTGKSQSTLSTDAAGAKPPSGSLTSRMQQGKTSNQQDLSKSVPSSSVNTPTAAFGYQKPGIKASDAASSDKSVVKSESHTVLDSKEAEGNRVESAKGKEPLVRITFGEIKTKPVNVISKYCDPSVLNHTPVIVNPFENLTAYQTLKDKNAGEASAASDVCCVVGGKTEKDSMSVKGKGKGRQGKGSAKKVSSAKRPTSGTSRQASAGKKGRGTKGKESKSGDAEDSAVPKSSKRVRSAKRRGKKAAEKELDKEAELLAQMAAKGDVALISGIGWHVATTCADTSDVITATELHMDSSSSDSEISDVESIEDAETLMKHLDVSKSNVSLTSPRFREIKTEKEKSEAMKKIPAMISDGFPPMNLDMTQRDSLPLHPNLQVTEVSDDNFAYDYDISDPSASVDTQGINNELFLEMQMGKLTPIAEVLSVSVGQGSNVAEAINRFDRSLKENQLDYLLDGTPRNKASTAAENHQTSATTSMKGNEKPPVPKDSSSKTVGKTNKAPHIEVSAASSSSSKQSRGDAHPRRTQSLKEGKQSEKRDRSRRERKFSESKRELNNEEEIEDAIEEILSATNTSMSSTLRSNASASSTLKSNSNTLTEGDLHLLRRLKEHAKESPFHATRESSQDVRNDDDDDDDDDASTIIGDQPGSGSGERLGQETNPNLLKVMHAKQFDLGAKVKAMIDAGADKKKVKAMMKADEENPQLVAKQLVKVMNSFRHMELHAGHKEPPVSSESHKASRVTAAALDKVPLVRPSSAGAAKTKGRFHELKKGAAGGSNQQLAERKEGKSEDSEHEIVGAQGDVAEAMVGDVARDVLANTAGSETMCSRLSRRSSRSGSASTQGSSEEETIQWKKGNVLGKGAFGTVWCGLTNEGELIAVKQIDTTTDIRKAEREYEKVQEEVELLKTLNHINIVGYLGTSFEDGTVSIFMQFVPGGSIASILARFGALDEAVFRRYTRQILQGVQYLHENDVIHRDIKGGNVMLMPSGIIKLIDFGCAKRLCINLSLSQSQILRSMKGTPYWMAPEVVNESGHGKKSDIWSIGCTVFEMSTMKPPWAEMNPMAAIFAIGSDRTVPKLPSKFSPEAIAFVNRCLTRNQQERPSATELLTDAFMVEYPAKK